MTAQPEIVLTVGIPGAGKSTLAATCTNHVRISRDDLRTELFGPHYHHGAPDPDLEAVVTATQVQRARHALRTGHAVIIDDTNLEPATRALWAQEASTHNVPLRQWVIDTPLETALRRNAQRARTVPAQVIVAMWMHGVAQGLLAA